MSVQYPRINGPGVHRIVAEEKLGRPLRHGEVVHHVNGDPYDNRPENLHVCTQVEHMAEHGSPLVTTAEIEDLIMIGYGADEIVRRCRIGTHRLVRIRRALEDRIGTRVAMIPYKLGVVKPKRQKKFDWIEAQRLRESGLTLNAIGDRMGVTGEAVGYALRQLARKERAAVLNPPPPYPQFCRHPDKCAGLSCCPRDMSCID